MSSLCRVSGYPRSTLPVPERTGTSLDFITQYQTGSTNGRNPVCLSCDFNPVRSLDPGTFPLRGLDVEGHGVIVVVPYTTRTKVLSSQGKDLPTASRDERTTVYVPWV